LEVPQLLRVDGRWRIVFSALPEDHSEARRDRRGVVQEGGTQVLASDEPFGQYRLHSDRFLVGDARGSLYAGRFLHHWGRWHYFAWRQFDDAGRFVGELTDPMSGPVSRLRSAGNGHHSLVE
jgi:beta-fructofuranosidase